MKRIYLTKGKVALVDDADFDWLSQWCWHAHPTHGGNFYAAHAFKGPQGYRKSMMHTLILKPPEGRFVDHRDGSGLNNQRGNLRECTRSDNAHNRKKTHGNPNGFKGISFDKARNRWWAGIRYGKRRITIGYFRDAEHAAKAYDWKARELFREFALTNFKEAKHARG